MAIIHVKCLNFIIHITTHLNTPHQQIRWFKVTWICLTFIFWQWHRSPVPRCNLHQHLYLRRRSRSHQFLTEQMHHCWKWFGHLQHHLESGHLQRGIFHMSNNSFRPCEKKSKRKCRANGFVEYLKMDIGNYLRKILFKSVDAYQLPGFHWKKKMLQLQGLSEKYKCAVIIRLKLLQVNLWNVQGSPFQQNTPILNKGFHWYPVAHPSELPESPFPNHLVVDHPMSRQHHLPILQQTHSHWLLAVARCATGPIRPRPHHPRQRRPNRLWCHHPWALRRHAWWPQCVAPRFSEPKVKWFSTRCPEF